MDLYSADGLTPKLARKEVMCHLQMTLEHLLLYDIINFSYSMLLLTTGSLAVGYGGRNLGGHVGQ